MLKYKYVKVTGTTFKLKKDDEGNVIENVVLKCISIFILNQLKVLKQLDTTMINTLIMIVQIVNRINYM